MQDDLSSLTSTWPLLDGFSQPQAFTDEIEIAGALVRRAGIQSTAPSGEEVTGSAAVVEGSPLERAYFELLERASILDASVRACPIRDAAGRLLGTTAPVSPCRDPRSRPARSNGVALHRTWDEACRRARYELAERDRTLGAWYGELPLVAAQLPSSVAAFDATHDWIARTIPPAPGSRVDTDIEVAVVLGFPREPGIPLARGFAGHASREGAVEAAAMEAVQSLAFVWGEPLPSEPPQLTPTPLFHLDYYLWPGHHDHLREWVTSKPSTAPARGATSDDETQFIDLTPATFGDSLRVVRAVRGSARALVFGEASAQLLSLLPPARHVHPIS
jgi:hypothetical protein